MHIFIQSVHFIKLNNNKSIAHDTLLHTIAA